MALVGLINPVAGLAWEGVLGMPPHIPTLSTSTPYSVVCWLALSSSAILWPSSRHFYQGLVAVFSRPPLQQGGGGHFEYGQVAILFLERK